MGNLIYSSDFITVDNADITIRSERTGYDKINIMDYWHLGKTSQANDLTKSDANPLYRIDMGSAQSVAAIYLNHVNYDTVRVFGHASDLSTNWAGATFDSGSDASVSQNPITGRYQIFIPLTSFNYRWIAITTPAAASAVGDQTIYWETSSIAILDSYTTLTANINADLLEDVEEFYRNVGNDQIISLSDYLRAIIEIKFGIRQLSDRAELRSFNQNISVNQPAIIYLNQGNDEDAYLVRRYGLYGSRYLGPNVITGTRSIIFKEIIGGMQQ